jgi:hypothetical protein
VSPIAPRRLKPAVRLLAVCLGVLSYDVERTVDEYVSLEPTPRVQ